LTAGGVSIADVLGSDATSVPPGTGDLMTRIASKQTVTERDIVAS